MRIFNKKQVSRVIIGLMLVLLIVSIVLFLYSYLTDFTGLDGTTASLAHSESFFDKGFFSESSYNTDNFPIIPSLLRANRAGLILALISAAVIFNFWFVHFLKKRY